MEEPAKDVQNVKRRHLKTDVFVSEFFCADCSKYFRHRQSLYRHKINMHKFQDQDDGLCRCREKGCSYKGATMHFFRQHLKKHHSLDFDEGSVEFESEKEYLEWKEKLEDKNRFEFVKKYGTRKFSTKSVTYYYCNRTGVIKPKASSRKSYTFKTGYSCTATLIVERDLEEGSVQVRYCNTHYGHIMPKNHFNTKNSNGTSPN